MALNRKQANAMQLSQRPYCNCMMATRLTSVCLRATGNSSSHPGEYASWIRASCK